MKRRFSPWLLGMVWNLCAADTTLTTRLALTGSVIYAEPGQPGYRHTDLDSAQSSGDPFSLLTGSTECPVDSELQDRCPRVGGAR